MARLNEPPIAPAPSTETIDAVKRRFLRQNRELAKTNSQQSIRIRTLENDCSRLLAENLSLREQVLQLQNTLEAHSKRPSFSAIDSVKDQLEAKIQELGGLVAELGQLKKRESLPRCKSQTAATRRSPDERQWRSGLGLQEVENAMLPTIAEDKYYPRRTMNADEMQEILEDPDSQSPDIGPPPVSRFENEDPIAFDPNPPPAEQQEDIVENAERLLPATLETRRRRRESGPKANIRRVSLFESPPDESEETQAKVVRAGAKRKFSVQEDEEKTRAQQEPFRFSRRNTATPTENEDVAKDAQLKSSERPVLGSKPVNTDPILSPKKQRSVTIDKPEKPEKKTLSKTGRGRLTITRNVQAELPPNEIPQPIPTAEIMLDSLPPKTPAPEDIFSPPSTEPSTSRPESKDTPPPADLNSNDQTGRPSRRVRAQVSYKEPSLNTKMRRPGKELVDAVVTDQARRSSVEPQSVSEKMTIKLEPDDSAWKPMGAVERSRGEEDGEIGSPLRQKLDRREGSQEPKSDPPKLNSVAASNAISALIEETSITKRKVAAPSASVSFDKATSEPSESKPQVTEKGVKTVALRQDQKPELAVFDFNESSPPTAAPSTTSRPRIDLAKAARSARRHSSVPASNVEEKKPEMNSKPDGSLPTVHKRTVSGNIRSSSTTSLGKSAGTARVSMKDRERRMGPLPASSSSFDLKAKAEGDIPNTGSLRAERAASRRKSMLV